MATASAYHITPPDLFQFSAPTEWPKWKQRFLRFRTASGLNTKSQEEQVDALIYFMGEKAEDIFLAFTLTDAEKKNFQVVLNKFDDHFIVKRNVIFERAQFNRRLQREDFFKIGGFNLLPPLLACTDSSVVAAAAELIADICQNNEFCQSKMLDFNVMPELVKLMDAHSDPKVCFKALYALSCLCRHNEDALKQLEITSFLPVLLKLLQMPDQRLRAKTAFFLSHLASKENFRETLYQADIIGILVKLLNSEHDSSSEHLLSALEAMVAHHKQSRIQCRKEENNLKQMLLKKIENYELNSACDEAKEHCSKILELCFHDQKIS